jgi:archaellum biogenesis ATPase FlaH
MNNLDISRHFVNVMGWSVIPLEPKGKKPVIQWEHYQSNKPTEKELIRWFSETDYNIGIVTGKISNLVVVDSDDGSEAPFGLNSELKVKTSKGYHLYFSYTDGIKNKVRVNGQQVDVRGDGGYVVAPFSIHETGHMYRFVLPEGKKVHQCKMQPIGEKFEQTISEPKQTPEFKPIIGTNEGSRNDSLFRKLAGLEKLPMQKAWEIALAFNQTFNPPLEQREVLQIFKSVTKYANFAPEETPMARPRNLSNIADELKAHQELIKKAPSTGFEILDQIIRGFLPTHFYLLTGDTNSGKSSLAVNFAYNVSMQQKKVLYLALEPDINIGLFFACMISNKKFNELTDEDYKMNNPYIDILLQEDCKTFADLIQIIKLNGSRYDLIIVDHLGYFVTGTANTTQEQNNLYKQLALATKELQTAILGIVHPRKTKAGEKIDINDIAGGAGAKQDATEVLILQRERLNKDDEHDLTLSSNAKLQVAKSKTQSAVNKTTIDIVFTIGSPEVIERKYAIT